MSEPRSTNAADFMFQLAHLGDRFFKVQFATLRTKRAPAPKLQQQNERIQKLPHSQQRFVRQMLDTVIAQASR